MTGELSFSGTTRTMTVAVPVRGGDASSMATT